MKKLKLLISSVLIAAAVVAGATAAGCKKKPGDNPGEQHEHTYKTEWSYDGIRHWHETTCEHQGEEYWSDIGEHRFNIDGVCQDCNYKKFGISVTKTTTDYVLDGKQTANVTLDDLKVQTVYLDGTEGENISSSDYTLSIYKGKEEVSQSDLSKATAGTYNIWAKAEVNGAEQEAFVIVYVIDELVDFNRTVIGQTSQNLGLDVMSQTWEFEASYKSGKTETVTVSDNRVSLTNFSTFTEATGKEVTVTFTDINCKGKVVSKAVPFRYNITKAESDSVVINTYSFDALKATLPTAQQNENRVSGLTNANFTGDNAFITVDKGIVDYRGPSNNTLEIRGDALNVSFEGVGIIVIDAKSTGSSNISSIAIMDEDGNYIAATYSSTTTSKDDYENVYTITGDSNVLTFNIEKAGKYTICTLTGATVDGDIVDTDRYTRITSLTTTDVRGK